MRSCDKCGSKGVFTMQIDNTMPETSGLKEWPMDFCYDCMFKVVGFLDEFLGIPEEDRIRI